MTRTPALSTGHRLLQLHLPPLYSTLAGTSPIALTPSFGSCSPPASSVCAATATASRSRTPLGATARPVASNLQQSDVGSTLTWPGLSARVGQDRGDPPYLLYLYPPLLSSSQRAHRPPMPLNQLPRAPRRSSAPHSELQPCQSPSPTCSPSSSRREAEQSSSQSTTAMTASPANPACR